MGQLIKLQDYVSRYEQDIYHYSSQFVRLKKQQWNKLKIDYVDGNINDWLIGAESSESSGKMDESIKKRQLPEKFRKLVNRIKREQLPIPIQEEQAVARHEQELGRFLKSLPRTESDLKQQFLDRMYHFQLKWASSTIREKSMVNANYIYDQRLRYFLQRFPDTCLILYKPVFQLKNAPVELDIVMITPTEIWCLTFLEAEEEAVFLAEKGRFWTRRHHNRADKKVLNPYLSINRMERIITRILTSREIDMPIRKGILCRNGYIDDVNNSRTEMIIDKRSYTKWFEGMRNNQSPIKNQQLKSARALLDYCSTAYKIRMDLEEELEELDRESGF